MMKMRQIKFRAYDQSKKEWLLGSDSEGFSMFGECMLFGEWSKVVDLYVFERDGRKGWDLILEQFTGLKDKDGEDIYEGDAVLIYDNDGDAFIYQIKWDEKRYMMVGTSNQNDDTLYIEEFEGCKILGNIHDNPDLV